MPWITTRGRAALTKFYAFRTLMTGSLRRKRKLRANIQLTAVEM